MVDIMAVLAEEELVGGANSDDGAIKICVLSLLILRLSFYRSL